MSQSGRRKFVKFCITVLVVGAGLFWAAQPTALVNAQKELLAVAQCSVDTNKNGIIEATETQKTDCDNVCLIFGNCPTALTGSQDQKGVGARTTIVNVVNIVANALIGLAAIISVFFIIYAGWMILSGGGKGNGDGIKEGQQILTNAFIGLAVSILSFVIVQYMVGFLSSVFK